MIARDGQEGMGERGEDMQQSTPGRNGAPSSAYLECQQALVDLSALQAGLPVGTGRVGATLVPRQVDEGKLAVHFALPPQNDLEDGVATRRVGVGRRLPRRSGVVVMDRDEKGV